MVLLAVSGGPDSMALLNDYKKSKIVVAHVNYNKRDDSHIDQKIVEDFCNKYQIPCEVLSITEKNVGNFQKWAREKRYEFFKKIYAKYECNKLLMAHHNDDFIETALMQQQSGRIPSYFGIKKKNVINGMNIYRPYIFSYWKQDLIDMNNKNNIKYATDYTNAQPIYTRNKIRIALSKKTLKEKKSILGWFKMSNKILKKRNKRINIQFKKWSEEKFNVKFWRESKYKDELLYKFIYKDNHDVKLSKNKIENIKSFLEHDTQSKRYKLNDKLYLVKDKNLLYLSQ